MPTKITGSAVHSSVLLLSFSICRKSLTTEDYFSKEADGVDDDNSDDDDDVHSPRLETASAVCIVIML